MALRYKLLSVSQITPELRRDMFDLFSQYYFDVTFERFSSDLSEKNSVIMLWDEGTKSKPLLFGFSTVLIRQIPEGGYVLYSGDTVVHQNYWGSRLLQTAFSATVLRARLRHPFHPLYWMLLSKGFKTYMLMRRNFPVSYPSYKGEIPRDIAQIKDSFYQKKFGADYKAQESLIDFGQSLGRVKDQHAVATERDLRNRDVRFFLEKNPRYNEGVELACVATIRWVDILKLMTKYIIPLKAKNNEKVAGKTIET